MHEASRHPIEAQREEEDGLCAVPVDQADKPVEPHCVACTDEEVVEIVHMNRTTHLEDGDSGANVVVVGVEFDVGQAVQRAISLAAMSSTKEDIAEAVLDISVGGDGGPV